MAGLSITLSSFLPNSLYLFNRCCCCCCITKGIRNDPELHVFQPYGTPAYNRRKLWLSICQVQEWEAVVDPATTLLYYQVGCEAVFVFTPLYAPLTHPLSAHLPEQHIGGSAMGDA